MFFIILFKNIIKLFDQYYVWKTTSLKWPSKMLTKTGSFQNVFHDRTQGFRSKTLEFGSDFPLKFLNFSRFFSFYKQPNKNKSGAVKSDEGGVWKQIQHLFFNYSVISRRTSFVALAVWLSLTALHKKISSIVIYRTPLNLSGWPSSFSKKYWPKTLSTITLQQTAFLGCNRCWCNFLRFSAHQNLQF